MFKNIKPSSEIITDDREGYSESSKHGYDHKVKPSNSEMLANVHRVVALLKRWLLGTHQGAVRPKQLQHYLDEFSFRYNRRKSRQVSKIFYRMLQGVTTNSPQAFSQIVGRTNADLPLDIDTT